MNKEAQAHNSISKTILYATIISGFVAAHLMYRRGESLVSIAKKTVTNPIGSLFPK
jgi:putative effector of murein hydrolase